MTRKADAGSGYANPFRNARVRPGRIDQGIDYSGTGPIHALGPGVIEQTTNAGWQPGGAFVAERLTAGPNAGQYVYFAEDINPTVKVGQRVDASTVIGYFAPPGGVIEAGWAAPPPNLGQALAYTQGQASPGPDPGANPTPLGQDFAGLLGSLGAPVSPGTSDGGGAGGLPVAQDNACLISLPSFQVGHLIGLPIGPTLGGQCLFAKSQARALIGGALVVAGAAVMAAGLAILLGVSVARSPAAKEAAKAATAVPGEGTAAKAATAAAP